MIVCSWPIVVVHVVVPLLESELAIDPGTLEVRDKVFDIVRFWGFLLNSTKLWGQKRLLLSSAQKNSGYHR